MFSVVLLLVVGSHWSSSVSTEIVRPTAGALTPVTFGVGGVNVSQYASESARPAPERNDFTCSQKRAASGEADAGRDRLPSEAACAATLRATRCPPASVHVTSPEVRSPLGTTRASQPADAAVPPSANGLAH